MSNEHDSNTAQHNILVVENDDADLLLLKKQLDRIWPKSKVLAVESLQEAYKAYRDNKVDLVLLDLNLPDGHGPATVGEMRKINRSVPIIVVTGLKTDVAVSEALKLGANNVVLKSQISHPDFVNVLEQNVRSTE